MPISHIELTIKDRILQVIKHKNLDLRKLAEKYELKHRTLAEQVTTENAKIGCSVIYLIANEHHDVSLEWVMTGRGQMIKPPLQINQPSKIESLSFRLNSATPTTSMVPQEVQGSEIEKLQALNDDYKYMIELQRYKIKKLTEENELLKQAK
jgi:hypothetical protein